DDTPEPDRRLQVRFRQPSDPRHHHTRFIRRAAWRRDGTAAGLRQGDSEHRPDRAGFPPSVFADRVSTLRPDPGASAAVAEGWSGVAFGRGGLRSSDYRLWSFQMVLAVLPDALCL